MEVVDEGWVLVDDLLFALKECRSKWSDVSIDDIKWIIRDSSKQRVEILDDKIRVLYGHSIPHKLKKEKAVPPEYLFHVTSRSVVPQILQSGLSPMSIYLLEPRMVTMVGKRRDERPDILVINAREAHEAGRFNSSKIHITEGVR